MDLWTRRCFDSALQRIWASYFWTAKSMQKLTAMMASGHGLPARVHNENAHTVSAHCDFSRAVMHPRHRQTMLFLHPSRPQTLFYSKIGVLILAINLFSHSGETIKTVPSVFDVRGVGIGCLPSRLPERECKDLYEQLWIHNKEVSVKVSINQLYFRSSGASLFEIDK